MDGYIYHGFTLYACTRLDPSVLAKIQNGAHYAKFKNERRILIGYWLGQQLLALMPCTTSVYMYCV